MADGRQYTGGVTDWVTVGITALPIGWINVYRDNVTGELYTQPCPALMLDEATSYQRWWDTPDGRQCSETVQCERQTRTVFAEFEDGSPELAAVERGHGSGYLYTTTEAEYARREAGDGA